MYDATSHLLKFGLKPADIKGWNFTMKATVRVLGPRQHEDELHW